MTKIISVLGIALTISDNAKDLEDAISNDLPVVAVIGDAFPKNLQEQTLPFTRFAVTSDFFDEPEDVRNSFYKRVVFRHLGKPIVLAGDDFLSIRELCTLDVDLLIRIYEEAEGSIEPFYSKKEEAWSFLEEYTKNVYDLSPFGVFGIIDDTSKLIGIVGVISKDAYIELSYALLKEYEGMGYALAACKMALKACHVEDERIVVNINRDNIKSIRLANRLSKSYRIEKRILS